MNHIRKLAIFATIAILFCLCASREHAQTDNWISVRALRPNTELIVVQKNDDKVIGLGGMWLGKKHGKGKSKGGLAYSAR